MKTNIFDLSFSDLKKMLSQKDIQAFRVQQIVDWIYKKNILAFSAMTNLSEKLRTDLEQTFTLDIPVIKQVAHSPKDNSYKFLLESKAVTDTAPCKTNLIEAILMQEKDLPASM